VIDNIGSYCANDIKLLGRKGREDKSSTRKLRELLTGEIGKFLDQLEIWTSFKFITELLEALDELQIEGSNSNIVQDSGNASKLSNCSKTETRLPLTRDHALTVILNLYRLTSGTACNPDSLEPVDETRSLLDTIAFMNGLLASPKPLPFLAPAADQANPSTLPTLPTPALSSLPLSTALLTLTSMLTVCLFRAIRSDEESEDWSEVSDLLDEWVSEMMRESNSSLYVIPECCNMEFPGTGVAVLRFDKDVKIRSMEKVVYLETIDPHTGQSELNRYSISLLSGHSLFDQNTVGDLLQQLRNSLPDLTECILFEITEGYIPIVCSLSTPLHSIGNLLAGSWIVSNKVTGNSLNSDDYDHYILILEKNAHEVIYIFRSLSLGCSKDMLVDSLGPAILASE